MKCYRVWIISLALLLLLLTTFTLAAKEPKDDCEKCGPTRLIGCRNGRCYYKCIRRCLGKDGKFYYESLKFNFAGQR